MIVGRDALSGRLIGLSVENGKIAALRHIEEDLDGDIPWLAPGLVDLQVNGWGGHDFNGHDINEEKVLAIAVGMRCQGIRAFLPTLITASSDTICNALSVIAAARKKYQWLAKMIPGVHVEGPFISPEDGHGRSSTGTCSRPFPNGIRSMARSLGRNCATGDPLP